VKIVGGLAACRSRSFENINNLIPQSRTKTQRLTRNNSFVFQELFHSFARSGRPFSSGLRCREKGFFSWSNTHAAPPYNYAFGSHQSQFITSAARPHSVILIPPYGRRLAVVSKCRDSSPSANKNGELLAMTGSGDLIETRNWKSEARSLSEITILLRRIDRFQEISCA
jgi:hypothetical protein